MRWDPDRCHFHEPSDSQDGCFPVDSSLCFSNVVSSLTPPTGLLFVCLFFFCILQGFVRFYFKSIHSQENLVQCNRNPGSIQVKSSIPILRNKTRSKPHNKSKSGWPTRCLSREAAADRVLLSFKKACAPS